MVLCGALIQHVMPLGTHELFNPSVFEQLHKGFFMNVL